MKLEIQEVNSPQAIGAHAIRARAEQAGRFGSRLFVAREQNVEVGFLAYDDRSSQGIGVIYEVLVLPAFRHRGIGGQLVEFGEALAVKLGCNIAILNPKAFDGSVDQSWLENFYRKRGYVPHPEDGPDWQKPLRSRRSCPAV